MTDLAKLHRRLVITLGVAAVIAFLSGAGLDTPLILVAAGVLVLAWFWEPSQRVHERMEWFWRIAAILLSIRAIRLVFVLPEDVVLPMVDVLLVLLMSESLRPTTTTERTRMYSLSFALLVGAAAYRAGVAFGIAFIVYITAGTVALMVGHVLYESRRYGRKPPALARPFLFRVAALSSVMLFMSGLLFVAFPRVTRTWVTRGTPALGNVIGFSDRVSLSDHGGRIYPNPEVVLRVEFPEGRPTGNRALYWRGRSYDYFDGVSWWHSHRVINARVPSRVYREWPGESVRHKVYATPLDVPVLFTLHPVLDVLAVSRLRWQIEPSGDLFYEGFAAPVYEAISKIQQPSDDQLRSASTATQNIDDAYLQLPEVSGRMRALADSLISGTTTTVDRAHAIESWLRTQFRYTLELPATASEAGLENFLFERRAGHCEYFSSAMVVLLRLAGIPARNVNGFMGGQWNEFGNFLTVTQNQAHSWVEVWLPRFGWVMFDPTPSAVSEAAGTRNNWFVPLRFMFDGLEHRWNKWVLEYNLETQMSYFQRVADAISRPTSTGQRETSLPIRQIAPYFFAALLLFVLIRTFRGRGIAGRGSQSLETRLYIKLRRLYGRKGIGTNGEPPLAFVRALELTGAPNLSDARDIVRLYLDSRFGGIDIGEPSRVRMRRALDAVRRGLRGAGSTAA